MGRKKEEIEQKQFGAEVHLQRFVLSRNSSDLLKNFKCGNEAIDEFFQNEAAEDETRVTYVYINEDNGDIVACVTIECSAIYFESKGGRSLSDYISAIEIVFFAIDEKYQHLRMSKASKFTLSDCIMRNVLMMLKDISQKTVGAAKVVLYSVPDAVSFYLRNNFYFFEENMLTSHWEFLKGCYPMHYDLNYTA